MSIKTIATHTNEQRLQVAASARTAASRYTRLPTSRNIEIAASSAFNHMNQAHSRLEFPPAALTTNQACNILATIIDTLRDERVVPREPIIGGRFNHLYRNTGVPFKVFLNQIIQSGNVSVEGDEPFRIIWLINPSNSAVIKHEGADLYNPQARLTPTQDQELLEFLRLNMPQEVAGGRDGFANWLSQNGPSFIQLFAFSYLVELSQLLRNRNVTLDVNGKTVLNIEEPLAPTQLERQSSEELWEEDQMEVEKLVQSGAKLD